MLGKETQMGLNVGFCVSSAVCLPVLFLSSSPRLSKSDLADSFPETEAGSSLKFTFRKLKCGLACLVFAFLTLLPSDFSQGSHLDEEAPFPYRMAQGGT